VGPLSEFPCRLYLSAPVGHPPAILANMLADALSASDIAAVLYTAKATRSDDARTLMQPCREHGAAFIVAGDVPLAREIGADGVHISNIQAYKQARTELGREAIIGLTTPASRHESMCIGETGADYIIFDPGLPNPHGHTEASSLACLIGWWSGLFEIPCAAPAGADMDQNRALINAGVDFLVLDNTLWTSGQQVDQTLKAMNHLIAECGREQ